MLLLPFKTVAEPSGSPLFSCRSAIHEAAGAKAVPLYLGMIALHCGLGFALKFYFFSY